MRTLRVCSARAFSTACLTHHTAYEMNFTPWSGSNFRTAFSSPSFPMATSSARSSPWPWYFFTYEMTNRRFAVTNRSAAFSSPFCARLASRRSSAGSSMSGSFWMSWRYWSNADEGDERKYPLWDRVPVTCSIHALSTLSGLFKCGPWPADRTELFGGSTHSDQHRSGDAQCNVRHRERQRRKYATMTPNGSFGWLSAGPTGRCRLLQDMLGGSLDFVRLVAVMTPMPSATMIPTATQTAGTSSR